MIEVLPVPGGPNMMYGISSFLFLQPDTMLCTASTCSGLPAIFLS